MKIGTGLPSTDLTTISRAASDAEDRGYDYVTTSETAHNPFLPLTIAAEHTEKVRLRTSIALAFARSPMDMAYLAWDLQSLSNGRFELGLGSQVRGHIVRRYSMDWSKPASRMKEYVQALHAIWDCWQNGSRMSFVGEHYRFNLMPPFFNPGPIEHLRPKVYLAAVNANMLRVAGELADGVILHPFISERYVEEVVFPNLTKGLSASGRNLHDLDITGGGLIITGANDEEIEANTQIIKNRIAFYASTRSYASVMEIHGWGETAENLYRLSIENRWSEMSALITDEMLREFATIGRYDDVIEKLIQRTHPSITSLTFSIPTRSDAERERLKEMVETLKGS